ncbi:hypothetical protein VTK26DRAFT_7777 [Humicola hyalothermophila]
MTFYRLPSGLPVVVMIPAPAISGFIYYVVMGGADCRVHQSSGSFDHLPRHTCIVLMCVSDILPQLLHSKPRTRGGRVDRDATQSRLKMRREGAFHVENIHLSQAEKRQPAEAAVIGYFPRISTHHQSATRRRGSCNALCSVSRAAIGKANLTQPPKVVRSCDVSTASPTPCSLAISHKAI